MEKKTEKIFDCSKSSRNSAKIFPRSNSDITNNNKLLKIKNNLNSPNIEIKIIKTHITTNQNTNQLLKAEHQNLMDEQKPDYQKNLVDFSGSEKSEIKNPKKFDSEKNISEEKKVSENENGKKNLVFSSLEFSAKKALKLRYMNQIPKEFLNLEFEQPSEKILDIVVNQKSTNPNNIFENLMINPGAQLKRLASNNALKKNFFFKKLLIPENIKEKLPEKSK